MTLQAEMVDGVDWLAFDRAERLNSFTGADYGDLRRAVDRAINDPRCRVIVLTGTGRAFSAGADRSLVDGTASPQDREFAATELDALIAALGRCEKPIVAATVAAHDPEAVVATKRLLLSGRADAIRLAMDRENAAMSTLLNRVFETKIAAP